MGLGSISVVRPRDLSDPITYRVRLTAYRSLPPPSSLAMPSKRTKQTHRQRRKEDVLAEGINEIQRDIRAIEHEYHC